MKRIPSVNRSRTILKRKIVERDLGIIIKVVIFKTNQNRLAAISAQIDDGFMPGLNELCGNRWKRNIVNGYSQACSTAVSRDWIAGSIGGPPKSQVRGIEWDCYGLFNGREHIGERAR